MAHPVSTHANDVGHVPAGEAAEAVHSAETVPGAVAGDHGGGGLPQFDTAYWGGQIVWLLVLFALLYVLLSRVFIPRLRRALDEREATIAGALAAARQVQTEADAQAQAARDEIAEARNRAKRTTADAKARAQAEAATRQAAEETKLAQHLAQAEDRIRTARDAAMGNVRQIAQETAAAITEHLTGRAATTTEIDQALNRVGAA